VHLNSYEEMAALLAHEYSHVECRHTIKSMVRSTALYGIVSILFGDVSGLSAALIDNAKLLNNLHYGRGMEREADCKGIDLLNSSGINPQGMVRLMEQFKKLDDSSEVFDWFSTHPDTDKRIAYTKEYCSRTKQAQRRNDTLEELWKQLKNSR
jgi:predicted Zn-dependent protease